MPITLPSEAEKAWDSFYKKSYLSKKRKSNRLQDSASNRLSKIEVEQYMAVISAKFADTNKKHKFNSADSAARTIQTFWRHKKNVKDFFSNKSVYRSVNKRLADELLLAIKNGNWEEDIFSDVKLPYVALALFDQGKISYHQICTIFERLYVFEDFNPRKTYKILDHFGNFTPEAETILLPSITRPNLPLDATQKEAFRLLLLSLPPSEQIFYTTEVGYLKFNDNNADQLGNTLYKLGALYVHDYKEDAVIEHDKKQTSSFTASGHIISESGEGPLDKQDELEQQDDGRPLAEKNITEVEVTKKEIVRLSMGAFDALGIARFEENYVKPTFRLGMLTIDDIMAGVRQFTRPSSLPYPKWPFYSQIHGLKPITVLEAIDHEKFHSLQMSKTPKCIIKALWHISDFFTRQTTILKSKETWNWHDAEFNYAYDSDDVNIALVYKDSLEFLNNAVKPFSYLSQFNLENLSIEDNTDLFCRMLSTGKDYITNGGFLFLNNTHITPAGILTFIDMIEHPDMWQEFKIDPKFFPDNSSLVMAPFKNYYQRILSIYNNIRHDRPELKVFKCQLFFYLVEKNKTDQFESLCHYINENPDLVKTLKFEKVTKSARWSSQFQEILQCRIEDKVDLAQACNLTVLTNSESLVSPNYLRRFIAAKELRTSLSSSNLLQWRNNSFG
ncbi:hypothetical protein ACQUW5_00870 [Legionella sp. CNM-1927-20]|uniref:hypothetical protein n=1 Tax=Legionella sp. CNM-1927-20 TaxID=3422221 RepID=UPI00403AA9C8